MSGCEAFNKNSDNFLKMEHKSRISERRTRQLWSDTPDNGAWPTAIQQHPTELGLRPKTGVSLRFRPVPIAGRRSFLE